MGSQLLTPRQTALFLGLSLHTIHSRPWRRRVGLPAVRVGRVLRFEQAAVERFVKAQTERRRR